MVDEMEKPKADREARRAKRKAGPSRMSEWTKSADKDSLTRAFSFESKRDAYAFVRKAVRASDKQGQGLQLAIDGDKTVEVVLKTPGGGLAGRGMVRMLNHAAVGGDVDDAKTLEKEPAGE